MAYDIQLLGMHGEPLLTLHNFQVAKHRLSPMPELTNAHEVIYQLAQPHIVEHQLSTPPPETRKSVEVSEHARHEEVCISGYCPQFSTDILLGLCLCHC